MGHPLKGDIALLSETTGRVVAIGPETYPREAGV